MTEEQEFSLNLQQSTAITLNLKPSQKIECNKPGFDEIAVKVHIITKITNTNTKAMLGGVPRFSRPDLSHSHERLHNTSSTKYLRQSLWRSLGSYSIADLYCKINKAPLVNDFLLRERSVGESATTRMHGHSWVGIDHHGIFRAGTSRHENAWEY